jgi:CDP-diacylglycerol---glycerol-3-phosphate 3-phosphatidyltransferase
MLDLACSLFLLLVPVAVGAGYVARSALRGRLRSERVEREGRSHLIAKGLMEAFHWALAPFGALCVRLGITPNSVTFVSLAFGLAAGVAVAAGRLGVGALFAGISAAGDGLDGVVARLSGRASDAGEVLDAAVDRYTELALLGGLAVYLRASVPELVLALLAIGASFMISYSSAKAEALHVTPPRGSMRRSERAVLLVLGIALAPFAGLAVARSTDAPIVAALATIALVGNVSAIRRLSAIARAVPGVQPT